MAVCTLGKIVSNGIWTDNDWFDPVLGIGVENGEPYGDSDVTERKINSPKPIDGNVGDYMQKPNV